MTKRSMVLVMGVVLGCKVADPNPAMAPAGGSGGSSSAGVSSSGQGGVAPNTAGNGGAAGMGAGTGARSGASAEAGAGGFGDVPGEGGAAGDGPTLTEGGAGGEAGASGGGDGCTPACSSTQTCLTGVCKDQDCAPSAKFCAGSSLRTCAASGLSSVEVTTCGDGKYCDPDSASCKQGFTSCPNIYLGSGRFGANPRPASQANDAILMTSYDVQVGVAAAGQVRVNNLGTDDSPITHIELYLSQPTGNFPANQSQLIFQTDAVIPGAAIGGTEGEFTINWLHTFSTPGQYVLLARVENNSPPTGAACTKQGYDTSSPATDAQTAIHYLNVAE